MRFPSQPVKAIFIRRLSRFHAEVELNKERIQVHVANSGRLGELLIPLRTCYIMPVPSGHRRTSYDLVLVTDINGELVSADARLPNRLFMEAFHQGRMDPFREYGHIRTEVTVGHSRLDFVLTGAGSCYVEVKSVTLVQEGNACFPDAKTERGVRHLETLMAMKREGARSVLVFIVQRSDAEAVIPNDGSDPLFGRTIRNAVEKGVEILAYGCRVSLDDIRLGRSLPVRLSM